MEDEFAKQETLEKRENKIAEESVEWEKGMIFFLIFLEKCHPSNLILILQYECGFASVSDQVRWIFHL